MTNLTKTWITLIGLALMAGVNHAADLVLVDRVNVRSGVVRLADVAAILNATPEEIDALGRLPLMPAPAPGARQTLRGQSIRELLAAHQWDLSGLRFRGASQVEITANRLDEYGSPSVSARAEIDQQVEASQSASVPPQTGFRRELKPAFRQQSASRVRVSPRQLDQATELLAEQLSQHVKDETNQSMLYVMDVELRGQNAAMLAQAESPIVIRTLGSTGLGRRRFLVLFDTAEGPVKFTVHGRVVEARPAVLVRRDVPRGMLITAADVFVGPLPLQYRARGAETVLQSLDQVLGKEAARRMSVGDVVTDGNSLPPKMIQRGELVTVTAGSGAVRVRSKAKAMRDGRQGELIEVQTLDTQQRFDARVVGHGQLAVLSAGATAVRSVASLVEPVRAR